MNTQPRDRDDLARRAKDLYDRRIRKRVEAAGYNEGRYVAVDVDSGDYEIADDALRAGAGLRRRKPEASVYLMRVGRPTAFRLGSRSSAVLGGGVRSGISDPPVNPMGRAGRSAGEGGSQCSLRDCS